MWDILEAQIKTKFKSGLKIEKNLKRVTISHFVFVD